MAFLKKDYTTIQISRTDWEKLKLLQAALGAKTTGEVISKLLVLADEKTDKEMFTNMLIEEVKKNLKILGDNKEKEGLIKNDV